MPIAAIYGRVSTTDQKAGGLREADGQGATTREEYVILEDWSGTDLSRPGLLRLYQLAEDGLIDLVIILNLDRLPVSHRKRRRRVEDFFLVMERLENAGVEVIWTDQSLPSEGPLEVWPKSANRQLAHYTW